MKKHFHKLCALASLCFVIAFCANANAQANSHTLDIYWNDVEGGGATLIVTPAGESILIDAGNPGSRDAGRIFKTATTVAGLKHLDYFLLTHFHRDHFGGAPDLAALLPISQVFDKGIPDTD